MGWTSVESFRYFLSSADGCASDSARRRLQSLPAVGAGVGGVVLHGGRVRLPDGAWRGPAGYGLFTLCVGVTGLVNSVCMMLCFMPPERYLDGCSGAPAAVQGA